MATTQQSVLSSPVRGAKFSATSVPLPSWFTSAFGWLVVATFALIALGGSVRIMNAGLACPDWPLCFGDFIPDYHPQVYFEFIHRVLAGLVAIATVGLQWILFRSNVSKALKWLGAASLVLLATQVVFGGLTVLLQLHSKVVAAHLGMGTGFFALLMWMYLSLKRDEERREASAARSGVLAGATAAAGWVKPWSIFMGLALYGQILLGGMVASHFASLVCTDFPTCHGQWFPTFKGIIGLHVIHRLGAYIVFVLAAINLYLMKSRSGSDRLRKLAGGIFGMVLVQVGIGIANVLFHTPPLIAVAHLAMATAILSLIVRQIHFATQ